MLHVSYSPNGKTPRFILYVQYFLTFPFMQNIFQTIKQAFTWRMIIIKCQTNLLRPTPNKKEKIRLKMPTSCILFFWYIVSIILLS